MGPTRFSDETANRAEGKISFAAPAGAAIPPAAQTTPSSRFASLKLVVWYWLPVLLWMAMVLGASFDMFSARNTGSILLSLLKWAFGGVDAHTFEIVHFLVRKSAHFVEYAALSALSFRAWRGTLRGVWQTRWIGLALGLTLLVAIADEWHQAFMPSRTGSPRDVGLDFCGALFAQFLIWLLWRSHR